MELSYRYVRPLPDPMLDAEVRWSNLILDGGLGDFDRDQDQY